MDKKRNYCLVVLVVVSGFLGCDFAFEPKDFNDCILKYMKDAKGDVAADYIRVACADKFPREKKAKKVKSSPEDLPDNARKKIAGTANYIDSLGSPEIIGHLYNGDNEWTVTEIIVGFEGKKYKTDVLISPLSTKIFGVKVLSKNSTEEFFFGPWNL